MRHRRVRARITGTSTCPRVAIFKSNRHVFVQVIDDEAGKTLLSNTIAAKKAVKTKGTKTETAASVGKVIAANMKEKGISQAVFDRGGFKYHGRVKAVAEALREGGIKI